MKRAVLTGKLVTLFLIGGILLTGCDFGDTNVDPTSLPDVDVSLLLPAAQAQSARNLGSSGARVTGSVIQHFLGIDAQPEGYSSYLIDENTLNTYWRTGLYSAAMRDCHIIIEKSENEVAPHYAGIAKTLMALNLGIATTFWGDVPYESAFNEEDLTPSYDSQMNVYRSIQLLLDDAMNDLSQTSGSKSPGDDDLIFRGDAEAWMSTVRALKARYYLHLTKRDNMAAVKALDVLSQGDEMTNANIPLFRFGNSQNEGNPLAIFGEDRPNQLALGDHLLKLMLAFDDPRMSRYAARDGDVYVLYQRDNRNLFWTQFDSPLPLISRTEVLFIKAECHLRLGNTQMAESLFEEAITSNMEFLEIPAEDIQSYLTNIGQLSSLPSFDVMLEMMMEQKYIALFSQGTYESWVDFRRTGYPTLEPPSNASESFNPSKVIPRRYIYPKSERNTNNANLQMAIDRQGGHLLDVEMWAFK